MSKRAITPRDPEWPPRLNELGGLDPPERLFARGRPLDPKAPAVAVVGTRRPTAAGSAAGYRIARELAEAGFLIVSGLAVGIDATAHRAALDADAKTVAVLGCGLDVSYPARNAALNADAKTVAVLGCGLDVSYPARNAALKEKIADSGTLVTEYEDGTQPLKANFPKRNRIIAGLALGVVVVEGGMKSGALVTARLALHYQ